MLDIQAQLARQRIIPVVAIDSAECAAPLAEALAEAGLPCAEITLRTPAAFDAIRVLANVPDFLVGVGTVHNADDARRATEAGAEFVVTPGFNGKTVAWCLEHHIPIVPGTSSASDLEMALDFGLSVVKFFPAEPLGGAHMLRALSGPYPTLRFVPTGGIQLANLGDYLSLPSVVACGGTWLAKPDVVNRGNFVEVTRLAKEAIAEASRLST